MIQRLTAIFAVATVISLLLSNILGMLWIVLAQITLVLFIIFVGLLCLSGGKK